jgi:hypothetical protein
LAARGRGRRDHCRRGRRKATLAQKPVIGTIEPTTDD